MRRPIAAVVVPIKRDLGLAYGSTLVISLAITVVSAAGLIRGSDGLYPAGSPLVQVSRGGDAANLVLGLPALLGSMWLARRGSLIGLLLWPGALFYVLYAYALYLVGAPFSALFFGYVALVTLSAWTLISVVASIDGHEVRRRLATAPARGVGGALILIGVMAYVGLTAATIAALGGPATEPVRAARRASRSTRSRLSATTGPRATSAALPSRARSPRATNSRAASSSTPPDGPGSSGS